VYFVITSTTTQLHGEIIAVVNVANWSSKPVSDLGISGFTGTTACASIAKDIWDLPDESKLPNGVLVAGTPWNSGRMFTSVIHFPFLLLGNSHICLKVFSNMKVSRLYGDWGDAFYYTAEYRQLMEDHMTLLIADAIAGVERPTAVDVDKYRGDLNGLLLMFNVPAHLAWVTMRVNGLSTPQDLLREERVIYTVDPSYVDGIVKRYLSIKRQM